MRASSRVRWYRDPGVHRLIILGYLLWLAGLNLAWEIAHLSLYTLWKEAELSYIAFSVLHCTVGDIMIGAVTLVLALILGGEYATAHWRWRRIATVTALLGVVYTISSEWMNVSILHNWSYSESMPTLSFGGFELGLTPVAQWLILPPLALTLAKRTCA